MARVDTLTHFLTDVADAIRTKTGSSETIQASSFDTEIENIPSGSGFPPDWSQIGYSSAPASIITDYNYAKTKYDAWSNVANVSSKFYNDTDLVIAPLVNTSNATNMQQLFSGCTWLRNVPLLNTSNVTNMQSMLKNCKSLISVPSFDTGNVTTMQEMFYTCSSLKELPFLNTSKVTNFYGMFQGCSSITAVPQYDTSNGTNFDKMFQNCSSLVDVPILNLSKAPYLYNMFSACYELKGATSLDNILQSLIGATSYQGTKTLKTIGFDSRYQTTSTLTSLPHYQDLIDAGWTTGY